MTHVFYKNAVGCLVVFDQTKKPTLTRGAVKWKLDVDRKLNSRDEREIPCVLLGNKVKNALPRVSVMNDFQSI